MRSAGLTVETFGSGAEFLKSLETGLPDCVVLDLHMPHMDGFNVQTHLARKCAALPVIIVTGHDFPEARERAMAGGASAFLRKPVLDRTLLDAIKNSLQSPNMVLDMRIPLTKRYEQDVLDTALAQYLAGELDEAGAEQAIADGWNGITNEAGKDKQLAAYVASLGVQR